MLAIKIAEKNNLSVLRCEKILDDMIISIVKQLVMGRNVKLAGFGSFILRDKKARPGRNPKTNQQTIVAARQVVLFKPSIFIKNSLKEKPLAKNKSKTNG